VETPPNRDNTKDQTRPRGKKSQKMHSNVRDIPQTDFGIKSENVLTQPNNYTTGPYDFSLSSLDELIQDNGSLFDSTPASLTGGSELLNPQTGFQNSNSGVENSLANGSDPTYYANDDPGPSQPKKSKITTGDDTEVITKGFLKYFDDSFMEENPTSPSLPETENAMVERAEPVAADDNREIPKDPIMAKVVETNKCKWFEKPDRHMRMDVNSHNQIKLTTDYEGPMVFLVVPSHEVHRNDVIDASEMPGWNYRCPFQVWEDKKEETLFDKMLTLRGDQTNDVVHAFGNIFYHKKNSIINMLFGATSSINGTMESIKKWKLLGMAIKPEDIENVDTDGRIIIPSEALRRRFELNIQVVAPGVTSRAGPKKGTNVKEWLEGFCGINEISEKTLVKNQLLEELDRMSNEEIRKLIGKSLFGLLSSED